MRGFVTKFQASPEARTLMAVALGLLLLALPATAQLPGMIPGDSASFLQGQSSRWMGKLITPSGATFGEARVETMSSTETRLFVDAEHLVPGGVYSVWYSDGRNSTLLPLGDPDTVQADGRGDLHLHRSLNFQPVSNVVHVVLKYQPSNGVPQDALMGDLGKG